MKRIFNRTILLSAFTALTFSMSAQEVIRINGSSVTISEGDKSEIVNVFKETESPRFKDPKAPRFILTDQQGKWGLGIGGFVQAKVEYDFAGAIDDVDFIPALMSGGPVRNQFQMDASPSTIFLKLVGRTNKLGNFILYTAANWRGRSEEHTSELQSQDSISYAVFSLKKKNKYFDPHPF